MQKQKLKPCVEFVRPQKTNRLSLTTDWVFKHVMAHPDNRLALHSCLQSMQTGYPIREVNLNPNEEVVVFSAQKAIRYDIVGTINGNRNFNLEMQQRRKAKSEELRLLYYAARLFSGQSIRGKETDDLMSVWNIMITDFKVFAQQDMHVGNLFEMKAKTGIDLTDYFQLSIMEIEGALQLKEKEVSLLRPDEQWMAVFKFAGDPDQEKWIHAITRMNEGCRKAVERMMAIPAEMMEYIEETWRNIQMMEMQEQLNQARRSGLADGKEEGLREGRQKYLAKLIRSVQKKMHQGMSAAEIAEDWDEDIHLIQQIMFTFQFHPEWTMPQRIEILTKEKV